MRSSCRSSRESRLSARSSTDAGHAHARRHRRRRRAFYFFVDVSSHGDSASLARRILERRNVIVVPGTAFGEGGRGYLRISFAADEETIVEGVGRIREELSD